MKVDPRRCDEMLARTPVRRPGCWLTALLTLGATTVQAGSLRVWPEAVVVDDTVRLGDLCRLGGFDPSTEGRLVDLVVTKAPPPGGSRLIHIDMIRAAVAAGGINMATVTVYGAMQCAVTRPSVEVSETNEKSLLKQKKTARGKNRSQSFFRSKVAGTGRTKGAGQENAAHEHTLRQAVIDYFNKELARFGGTADIVFGRTSDQILDLSDPSYTFRIRRRGGPPLGLTPIEIDVITNGQVVQTVPLVVQVTMNRSALAARRAINQEATIRSDDVELVSVVVTRVDDGWLDAPALAVGQRARRFIPMGTLLEPAMIEAVPLVQRGQLVTLTSVVGGVRVVTTARADEEGFLGKTITVRAVDNRRVAFDVVVTGPGKVQMGGQVTGVASLAGSRGDRS